ncbi:extracellular solute-binding protein [Modestobacter sp. I12A-02628]|uniref:ABC transporter substrate-binding protein n=1 Tax=Goekera deserti TaxID=2497753 RepID=A0A7K3WBH5_9ACTN|nr:ABC transporter substrate-binding protein [Goekera deserti]MPQ97481.1 extracellular solute-binding protein [Goekera deserti]NDI47918.1 extracellular solute-binding protein [Goekera deserti]NEL53666.1 ABC transporter substrate-binding protein [Goekera deserti]
MSQYPFRPAPLSGVGLDRRRFLSLAGLGLSAAALAACSGGPDTSGAGASAATDDTDWSTVRPAAAITFWSSNPGASQAVTQQLIDAYNASQSETKVTLVTAGANYEEIAQKFQTAQAGGGLPDVTIFSDVWWFRYYMQKTIIPLDGLAEAVDMDLGDYRDQFVADYQYEGAQWAIPWARSTPIFYYNKDHWSKAGLEDRAPETWQEFEEWAPKLLAAGTGVQAAFQLPALAGYAGWTFQNNLWGWGGGWGSPDDFDVRCDATESIAALQFLQDAVYKGGWAGVASNSAPNDLTAAAVSATISSTGDLVGIQKSATFPVGAGFLPGGPAETSPVCMTGGAGMGIPKDIPKENQLAAAKFIKFMTEPENAVTFSAATGYIPVRKSADVSQLTATNPLLQIAIDQLEVTRTQDRARVFFPGADQAMANSCANILTQQADVAGEMSALKAALTTIYDRDVKPNL